MLSASAPAATRDRLPAQHSPDPTAHPTGGGQVGQQSKIQRRGGSPELRLRRVGPLLGVGVGAAAEGAGALGGALAVGADGPTDTAE